MKDGTFSQACEFSVCKLDSCPVTEPVILGKPWKIEFQTENIKAIHMLVHTDNLNYADPVAPHCLWLSDKNRKQGFVTVPANALNRTGTYSVFVTGENRYGRLKNHHIIDVVKPE
jgi:hypothetical protein